MFKRYLWKLCWLAFALVKRGESMKKTYLVVIVLFFISTKVYTLLHNNIFFCRNSPECDLSHVLPDYREQISGTPLKISIATVIPWVIGAIGMVLGGVCSDVIYRITGNALLSRRLILGVCLAGAAVCVAVSGTVSTIGSAITLMSVSLFLLYLTGPIYWAVIQDVVHKDKVGSVGGAMHGLANISGIIGPLVTGFIVQFSGKYDYAFYLAGAIAIVSSLLVFVFVKSKGFKANESQSCVH